MSSLTIYDLSPVKFYYWISSNFIKTGFVACLDGSILCPFILDMSFILIIYFTGDVNCIIMLLDMSMMLNVGFGCGGG